MIIKQQTAETKDTHVHKICKKRNHTEQISGSAVSRPLTGQMLPIKSTDMTRSVEIN